MKPYNPKDEDNLAAKLAQVRVSPDDQIAVRQSKPDRAPLIIGIFVVLGVGFLWSMVLDYSRQQEAIKAAEKERLAEEEAEQRRKFALEQRRLEQEAATARDYEIARYENAALQAYMDG